MDPFFVACAHANKEIKIRYRLLPEREVTFSGLIPGDCVVLSANIRVPSFKGEYKEFYKKKYGITKRIYNARKKILKTGTRQLIESTPETLLRKIILPHIKKTLEEHVRIVHEITLVCK